MSATSIGTIKSGKGQTYEVLWDSSSKELYVKPTWFMGASTHVGKASTASEAMTKAEAFLYNK
jgi:hypothetical protein